MTTRGGHASCEAACCSRKSRGTYVHEVLRGFATSSVPPRCLLELCFTVISALRYQYENRRMQHIQEVPIYTKLDLVNTRSQDKRQHTLIAQQLCDSKLHRRLQCNEETQLSRLHHQLLRTILMVKPQSTSTLESFAMALRFGSLESSMHLALRTKRNLSPPPQKQEFRCFKEDRAQR